MTDDQIIAAFRDVLDRGVCGDRELLMPAERDYSGMWSALCTKLVEWEGRYGRDAPLVVELRTEMNRLADERPDAVQVFALATTEYGRR